MKVPEVVLRTTNLYKRERFYAGFPSEEPLPAREEAGVPTVAKPTGFRSFTTREIPVGQKRLARGTERAFHLALRLHAQAAPVVRTAREYVDDLQRGTARYWCLRKEKLRASFYLSWARLCGPFSRLPTWKAPVERLMLPVSEEEGVEERRGLGWKTQPLLDTEWP